jgi:hypothetical protein
LPTLQLIDSSIIRVHQHTAGAKNGSPACSRPTARLVAIVTNQLGFSCALAMPIDRFRQSFCLLLWRRYAVTIVSRSNNDIARSPPKILPILQTETFIVPSRHLLSGNDLFVRQPSDARIEAAAIGHAEDQRDFVGLWCVRDADRHAIVV